MGARKDRVGRRHARWVRLVVCSVAVIAAATLGSVPVNATIIERHTETTPYEHVAWDCGYPMTVVGVRTDQIQVRADNRTDDIVFVTDNFSFEETWSVPDGRSFTMSGNALFKDVRAKSLGGSVYELTFHAPGQLQTLKDSSGNVIQRDRGNLSFTYTIDLSGGPGDFIRFKESGPHPTFDRWICKPVAPLVGSGSEHFLTERPIGSTEFAMGYDEYLPPSYSASGSPSPLLIFLNGYGENGDGTPDGIHTLVGAGIPMLINQGAWPTSRPFAVLALQHVDPGFDWSQCDDIPWGGSCGMFIQHDQNHASPAPCTTPDEVHGFVAYVVGHYNVDPHRVYVTGLSCGAFGTWEYVSKYGDTQGVAAAVPIAGEGRPAWTTSGCSLGSVPLWAFHGALDEVVNPQGSIVPMTNLAACPGVPADQAKLTVYPERDHNSWDPAYDGEFGDDIYTWMLGFSTP